MFYINKKSIKTQIYNDLTININLIYFQYEELSKMVTSTQTYLARTREGLIEAVNRLELQVM